MTKHYVLNEVGKRRGYALAAIALALGLSACSTTEEDLVGPALNITFPPAMSQTTSDSIVVRGGVADLSGVAEVRVNGAPATIAADGASWQLAISLQSGENLIRVEAVDVHGNSRAAAPLRLRRVELGAQPPASFPEAVAFDPSNNRALILERGRLSSVDLDTSAVSDFADDESAGPVLMSPKSIAVDAANDRAVVMDTGLQALVAVSLDDGQRELIFESVPGSSDIASLVLDGTGGHAVLLDVGRNLLADVDIAEGTISDVSLFGCDGNGLALTSPMSVAMAGNGHRAYVLDSGLRAVVDFDLDTGVCATLSDDRNGSGPSFAQVVSLAADSGRERALVLETNRLVEVDLASGDRTVLADDEVGNGPILGSAHALAMDESRERALVADSTLSALLMIDLRTGERVIMAP